MKHAQGARWPGDERNGENGDERNGIKRVPCLWVRVRVWMWGRMGGVGEDFGMGIFGYCFCVSCVLLCLID